MADQDRFSIRHDFQPPVAEITIRYDAPYELRGVALNIAYESGLTPSPLRGVVCRILRVREDPNNWSEYPNIAGEVEGLIDSCEWYEVYDIIEAVHCTLKRRDERSAYGEEEPRAEYFAQEINKYFVKAGIGWQLVDGKIQIRGPEAFEDAVRTARETLNDTDRTTASHEIHQALSDLSRRPEPDKTGAVQHAMAALECVARDVTGDTRATLGDLINRNPGLVPQPLDQAIVKAWGFASEMDRHLREGQEPNMEEAELIVGIASVVATYLAKKPSP